LLLILAYALTFYAYLNIHIHHALVLFEQ
jgi:hypothetical protein